MGSCISCISQETEGPYHTNLPTADNILQFLKLERVELNHTIKSQNVVLTPNQILTKELNQDLKHWEELIRENVFRLEGHRDHLPASLAHMLYCIVAEEQYNLAYFFVKRIKCARSNPTANLPYDLTQDDTKTPSLKHQLPSPSAPNVPSKTPSTKETYSSSIDYIPKSLTSSTSPSTNSYLNSPTSHPPRVPSPPLIQEVD
ncbi:hypothetical protein Tco_0286318 [Tanacetum coccineum]